MDDMDEVIIEFLVESHENLDRLDREFVELESAPQSREILASIFRTIHTIKGTSGFLGLDRLGAVSHAGESLLSRLRDGQIELNKPMIDALLAMVDAIRDMLACVEADRTDGSEAFQPLIERLMAFADGNVPEPVPEAAVEPVVVEPVAEVEDVEDVASDAESADEGEHDAPTAEELVASGGAGPAPAAPSPATRNRSGGESGPTSVSSTVDGSIRVDVRLLDRLMNLVGELVLARNQIQQYNSLLSDQAFFNTSQQLNLLTTELQEGVMKTRMQPIGNIWTKFPRVVRDLSAMCNKQVRIEMDGEETELDKTILEAIKDPMTHILRNSVDHGIELPADRVSAGKVAEGTIRLRAFHEGGQVIIEVADDGGGLNLDRIRAKALERGLVTSQELSRMGDREAASLIFLPGFSTAAEVTSVSGRGVGMDVVKTNIEKIGGTVDIQSDPGQGTTLTLKIPLTLAIIPALVVGCADDRYAIPQVNLVELLRLEAEQAKSAIELINGVPVYRLRGRLLPIVYLRDVLGYQDDPPSDDDAYNIVVLQADDRRFGLVVDAIRDTEEIVVKPLGPHLKSVKAYAGTTIMGDGAVSLILDAIGIAQEANVLSQVRDRNVFDDSENSGERRGDTVSQIVCGVGDQRIAIPLGLIDRLEEVQHESIERSAGRDVVQYRDHLLMLVPVHQFLGVEPRQTVVAEGEPEPPLQVLVYSSGSQSYGLVVDEILDIIDSDLSSAEEVASAMVHQAGVIGRRVTDLINVDHIIASYDASLGLSARAQ